MQGGIAALEDLHHCSTDVRVAVTGTITEIQTVGLTAVDFHKYSTSKIPQQMVPSLSKSFFPYANIM